MAFLGGFFRVFLGFCYFMKRRRVEVRLSRKTATDLGLGGELEKEKKKESRGRFEIIILHKARGPFAGCPSLLLALARKCHDHVKIRGACLKIDFYIFCRKAACAVDKPCKLAPINLWPSSSRLYTSVRHIVSSFALGIACRFHQSCTLCRQRLIFSLCFQLIDSDPASGP